MKISNVYKHKKHAEQTYRIVRITDDEIHLLSLDELIKDRHTRVVKKDRFLNDFKLIDINSLENN